MKKSLIIFFSFIFSMQNIFALSFEEKMIKINDGELYCKIFGSGKPLLIIHGGPGLSMDYLLPYLAVLAKDRKVIFYDQRGCGKSNANIDKTSINLETYLKDIETIKNFFNVEKMDLLGHSFGGFLAMNYAIKNPHDISSLILLGSMPASSECTEKFVQEFYKRIKPYENEYNSIVNSDEFKEGSSTISKKYYGLVFSTYLYDKDKIKLLDLNLSAKEFADGIRVHSLLTPLFFIPYNLTDSLKKLKVPSLVIYGDVDPVPFECAIEIKDSLKNVNFVMIKECGHFPYIEQPKEFFNVLFDFLKNDSKENQEATKVASF